MRTDLLGLQPKSIDLEKYMVEALKEAEEAGLAGELPIGAILVIDGEIVSRGQAHHQRRQSQLAHAEILALQNGGQSLWERYEDAVLFTTLEPCPMCLGAAVMADVPHIIFASRDEGVHSRQIVATNPYVQRHVKSYYGGVLEKEARDLISLYSPKLYRYVTAAT